MKNKILLFLLLIISLLLFAPPTYAATANTKDNVSYVLLTRAGMSRYRTFTFVDCINGEIFEISTIHNHPDIKTLDVWYDWVEQIAQDKNPNLPSKIIRQKIDENVLAKFLTELQKINIHRWERSYPNPPGVFDGVQWSLRVVHQDTPSFYCSGSNNYPSNWRDFRILLDKHLHKD